MKIQLATSCILLATVLAPIVVPAADQGADAKQSVAFVKDSELTARIKARLAEGKFASLPNITIESDAKGAVFLSGKVDSVREADKIILTVHRIEGVKAVKSLFSVPSDK